MYLFWWPKRKNSSLPHINVCPPCVGGGDYLTVVAHSSVVTCLIIPSWLSALVYAAAWGQQRTSMANYCNTHICCLVVGWNLVKLLLWCRSVWFRSDDLIFACKIKPDPPHLSKHTDTCSKTFLIFPFKVKKNLWAISWLNQSLVLLYRKLIAREIQQEGWDVMRHMFFKESINKVMSHLQNFNNKLSVLIFLCQWSVYT